MYTCLSFLLETLLTTVTMRHPKHQYLIYSSMESVRKTEIRDQPEEDGHHQEPDSWHEIKHEACEGRDDQDMDVKNNQDHKPLNMQETKLLYQDHYCNNISKYLMYILTTLPFLTYNFCDSSNYTFPLFPTVIRVTG